MSCALLLACGGAHLLLLAARAVRRIRSDPSRQQVNVGGLSRPPLCSAPADALERPARSQWQRRRRRRPRRSSQQQQPRPRTHLSDEVTAAFARVGVLRLSSSERASDPKPTPTPTHSSERPAQCQRSKGLSNRSAARRVSRPAGRQQVRANRSRLTDEEEFVSASSLLLFFALV